MRVRKKHWARPEIEESHIVITNPEMYKGKWKEEFNNSNPVYVELGCGTGGFITQNSVANPNMNFIGIDMKDEILVYAKRTIEAMKHPIHNVRLIPIQISFIDGIFEKNEVSRLYINFCNPWPKAKQNKRRLTHSSFLKMYKGFLKHDSQIWFKTDDTLLFEDSQRYFIESGFDIIYITYDLRASDFQGNIMTEYEMKFVEKGVSIMFLIARQK